MAGFISGGISFFSFPVAAFGLTGNIILASFVGLARTGDPFYQFVAVLLAVYGAYILFTILDLHRILLSHIAIELEVERQRDTVGLLLNDFEENGSDWIWRVDADWRVRDASPRLAVLLGTSPRDLEGSRLAARAEGGETWEPATGVERRLRELSIAKTAFRDFVIPVHLRDETAWWSLSESLSERIIEFPTIVAGVGTPTPVNPATIIRCTGDIDAFA